MSPTNKMITSLLCAAALWNCSAESADTAGVPSAATTLATVSLKLSHPETPLVDSLVLDCYGADTLHLVQDAGNANFNLELFPSDRWIFDAKLYANGNLMQKGELETKLSAGANANLNIQMHAVKGFVYIEIPLGLNNSAGIKSGKMILSSEKDHFEIPMTQTTTAAIFKSDMLPLGHNYEIEIALYDKDGKEIFKLNDSFMLDEDSPVPNLTLNALRSQVALAISIAAEKNLEISLPLPAGFRKPKADELLITEVFAAPDPKDSAQYEFVELYNGSLDTLLLDDCAIGLTSSSSTKFFPITTSEIAPNSVLVLGNPNSDKTPAVYIATEGWNDLGNSKGSVILKCDNVTLDSLYYSSEPDSLHPNVVPAVGSSKYGQSSQLDVDHWKNRKDSSAWKLTSPTPGMI